MVFKDVDWFVLAQCDYYAVQNLVQTPDRIAMQTVVPIRESIFQRKLTKEKSWNNAYKVACAAYQELGPMFSISHDSFGGYRLIYNGSAVIRPPHVFRRTPVGFVNSRRIHNKFVCNVIREIRKATHFVGTRKIC